MPRKPPLTVKQILKWADEHHRLFALYPTGGSGVIPGGGGETWRGVNVALLAGYRGLKLRTTLKNLMVKERGAPPRNPWRPRLTIPRILAWADAHEERTGKWPTEKSGRVYGAAGETWGAIERALRIAGRGLQQRSSLARLRAEHRGGRNRGNLPRLTQRQILRWADTYNSRTGRWPHQESGAIPNSNGETWSSVNAALRLGSRGLPGGGSLVLLLKANRNHFSGAHAPELSFDQILKWADDHHSRTGKWPSKDAGRVSTCPSETWSAVHAALSRGLRSLPGGNTLKQLLVKRRGVPVHSTYKPLTPRMILEWADAHKRRTGQWPHKRLGVVPNTGGEKWGAIDAALRNGTRSLAAGGSLAKLLAARRGVRNEQDLSPLKLSQMLAWADEHYARTGKWPTHKSGAIPGSAGEDWNALGQALSRGARGLPRTTIAWMLIKHRGKRSMVALPKLTESKILDYVGDHLRRTGRWPSALEGAIPGSGGETWRTVNYALSNGTRGLPRYKSLADFLHQYFGRETGSMRLGRFTIQMPYRGGRAKPPLNQDRIIAWARAYQKRMGRWPTLLSGPIPEAPGETWSTVNNALRSGSRGIVRANSSLARLLAARVGKRNHLALPRLTKAQILKWADNHFRRTGRWPRFKDREIPGSGGETWKAVWSAASAGCRGLPGTWTVDEVLVKERGKHSHLKRPKLNLAHIRKWARAHFDRTGKWPEYKSGEIPGTGGETWKAITHALAGATRGISRKTTLGQLNRSMDLATSGPSLKLDEIILWARAYHRRHGEWPERYSGRIPDAPRETWFKVDEALRKGQRGITKRTNLVELVRKLPTPRRFA